MSLQIANPSPSRKSSQPTSVPLSPILRIAQEVAQKHGTTAEQLIGPSRKMWLVEARWEAMYRCLRDTDFAIAAIGRRFAKHHSTVIYSVARYCRLHNLTPPRTGAAWAIFRDASGLPPHRRRYLGRKRT